MKKYFLLLAILLSVSPLMAQTDKVNNDENAVRETVENFLSGKDSAAAERALSKDAKIISVNARLGRMVEAFNEFREVVRLNPRDYQALGSLGIISAQGGKLEEAASYFQQALRVNPDDPIAKKYLDTVRARLGR